MSYFPVQTLPQVTSVDYMSGNFGGRYLVNQKLPKWCSGEFLCYRLVHVFTCACMLPHQYINFSTFAGIGTVGKWYIRKVLQQIYHTST